MTIEKFFRVILLVLGTLSVSACGSDGDSADGAGSAAPAAQDVTENSPPASDVAADEANGTITARFNGVERTWYITSAERGGQYVSQSDWSAVFGSQFSVSIMGHESPSWPFRSAQAILIGFTLQGTGDDSGVSDPSITYLSGGITKNHSSSHGGEAVVSVSSARLEGDVLELSGRFSGTLPYKAMTGSAEEEPEETIVVENGTFEGTIRRLAD